MNVHISLVKNGLNNGEMVIIPRMVSSVVLQ